MNNEIPRIIHYCWFGGKMPHKIKNNIDNWKNMLPEYEFIEWNENNFDYSSCRFANEAFENKKWAFVSDYVRLHALCEYGGIYLDTDVELIQKFDNLLKYNKLIISHESKNSLCTAVILANKNNPIVKGFLKEYQTKNFCENGKMQMKPNSELILEYLRTTNNGIKYDEKYDSDELLVLPQTYLCAKDIFNYKLLLTDNTYCIHQLDASWYNPGHKFLKRCKKIVRNVINKI